MEFYKRLHSFLGHWDFSRNAGKSAIGRFYNAIDPYLRQRDFLPHNAYQFVAKQVASCDDLQPSLQYDTKHDSEAKMVADSLDGEHMTLQQHFTPQIEEPTTMSMQDMTESLSILNKEEEIDSMSMDIKQALSNLTSKMQEMKIVYEKKLQKAHQKIDALQRDMIAVEAELENVKDAVAEEDEESSDDDSSTIISSTDDITYQTKSGRKYSIGIRKVYYNLLASGMPPGKISSTIKTVLQHFVPKLDVELVHLPKESCAQYMRREELKTINHIHKAVELSKHQQFHLNSDGTTLQQHKIGATTVNGMVLSVNELPDGTAEQIANDISTELEHLRNIAIALGLPNAHSINWSLVASSTSDSAATQKKFNEIAQQRKKKDMERFGEPSTESEPHEELLNNFCAMHLGVNLRKAFMQGITDCDISRSAVSRHYSEIDTFVHEFCKAFGSKGVPEYGAGLVSFPDFLEIGIKSGGECSNYYKSYQTITLDRQVGSRYFVTAYNAVKSLYLREAAQQYLEVFKKNKLEKDLYEKLADHDIMAGIKADGLMFIHVYANLVTLAKSQEIKKSALDMRVHYLELDSFLELLEQDPSTVFDKNIRVFASEKRLYEETKFNHRHKPTQKILCQRMFSPDQWDQKLIELIERGAVEMRKKLHTYAKDYLPSGKYWDPPKHIENILSQIQPSNDICESILGLNDWLHGSMTTACQLTKRNIIEAKKNKSLVWLNSQSEEQQHKAIQMAVKQRVEVKLNYKRHVGRIKEQRQNAMLEVIERERSKQEQNKKERMELSRIFVIANTTDFETVLKEIDDDEHLSTSKKTNKKKELLKMQIRVRKVMFDQKIKLQFTRGGRTIPVDQILEKFKIVIDNDPIPTVPAFNPAMLVHKEIQHRFYNRKSKRYEWYKGHILGYNAQSSKFEVKYEDEEEHCFFHLMTDYAIGDLDIL